MLIGTWSITLNTPAKSLANADCEGQRAAALQLWGGLPGREENSRIFFSSFNGANHDLSPTHISISCSLTTRVHGGTDRGEQNPVGQLLIGVLFPRGLHEQIHYSSYVQAPKMY